MTTEFEKLNTQIEELEAKSQELQDEINNLISRKSELRIKHLIEKDVLKNRKCELIIRDYKSSDDLTFCLIFEQTNDNLSQILHDIFDASWHTSYKFDENCEIEFSDGTISLYAKSEIHIKDIIKKYELSVDFDKNELLQTIKRKIKMYEKACFVLDIPNIINQGDI